MKSIKNFYKKQIALKLVFTFLIALALGYGTGKLVAKKFKKTESTELIKSN